jgi:hypothetical protein
MIETNPEYQAAKKRVCAIRDFYTHVVVYIVVNIGLFALNFVTSYGRWWFYWVIFGWGLGVLGHAYDVYGSNFFFGKDWEDKKIAEILDKGKNK